MTLIERVREFMVNHIAVGSRLEFRQVYGFPGYYVSNAGHIISAKRRKELMFLKHFIDPDGYKRMALYSDRRPIKKKVSRLILESFVGPPGEEMVARHKNGIRHEDRLDNLEWGTSQDNSDDMIRHGTRPIGVKNASAKLTEDQVRLIRESSESSPVLAEQFGVDRQTIWRIRAGPGWPHLK